jgi:hypothetical protein
LNDGYNVRTNVLLKKRDYRDLYLWEIHPLLLLMVLFR